MTYTSILPRAGGLIVLFAALAIIHPGTVAAAPQTHDGMSIEITAPKKGDTLKDGETVRISWTGSATISEVSIITIGNNLGVATHVPNTGYYDWKVQSPDPAGTTEMMFVVIGYGPEGKTVTDYSEVIPYSAPATATPQPTPGFEDPELFALKFANNPTFEAFQRTLDPTVMDSSPGRGNKGVVEVASGQPMLVAFPAKSRLPDPTILFVDDPYVYCFGQSRYADMQNYVLMCQARKVGKTAIMMFQPANDGSLQLAKEILVTILPAPSPSASPTPGASSTPRPRPSFPDVGSTHPLREAITLLQERGVIGGYPDGSFKPENPINRGEFAKIIIGALSDDVGNDGGCFSDVGQEWFAKYVCYAKKNGIIGGYPDGTFHAERTINVAEAVKIAMLAFGRMQSGDADGTNWYDKYINAANGRGYLRLIETLRTNPGTPMTRAWTAQLIANVMP